MRKLACIALLFAGCLDSIGPFDPQVGDPTAVRCVDDDSDPSTDVSFANDIGPLLRGEGASPGCNCHLRTAANPIGIQESGLDMTTIDSLRAGGVNSGGQIVVEGGPCDSILWQKVSPGPPFGGRMPFDGPPFLDAQMRQLISDWIAEGARDN